MKKLNLLAIVATGFAIATAPSCTKDDSGSSSTSSTSTTSTTSSTDIRDAASGTYLGIVTNTDADTTTTDSQTVVITKGTGSTLMINVDDGSFKTGDVIVAGSNCSGSIPSQTVTVKGDQFTVEGRGPAAQQFMYTKTNGTSAFTFHITVKMGTDEMQMDFTGTK